MSRIAKADVNRALEVAAKTLTRIGGADGKVSRAEVKNALATDRVARREAPLVDIFFKFVDHRDFKAGAQVTAKDIKKAVEYAKTHMVAKYDLNNNGLSQNEVAPPVVRELALDEVLLVGEGDETGAAARALEKRGLEISEAHV